MSDRDCSNCPEIKNLNNQLKSIWHNIGELKECNKDFEKRITTRETVAAANEEQFKSVFQTLKTITDKLDKTVDKLDILIEKQNDKVGKDELENLKNRIRELENKPAKKWDALVSCFISTVVGAIIGYFVKE